MPHAKSLGRKLIWKYYGPPRFVRSCPSRSRRYEQSQSVKIGHGQSKFLGYMLDSLLLKDITSCHKTEVDVPVDLR